MAARAGALSMAKRSYPRSEVRGSGLECQAVMAQERLRGATLRPRSGVAGKRHPTSEVRGGGQEELPHVLGQGRLGGDTPRPRSGAARRSHLSPEAKGGDPEEPPQARGQGRQLGGAIHARGQGRWPGWPGGTVVVRRYPSSKVRSSRCALLEQP